MVKALEPAAMAPWVRSGVQAGLSGGVGAHLSNERELAIKMGVPGDRADRCSSRSNCSRTRGERALIATPHQLYRSHTDK